MQSASQKDASPCAVGGVRTVDRVCFAPCVSMQTGVPTARWFTRWYDSSHVCIPAASREAVHVHGNNEVLLKIDQFPSIVLSFCLPKDLSGAASMNAYPCCCASCSPLPSSPTCLLSSVKQFPAFFFRGWGSRARTVEAMGSFREVGKSPHWFWGWSRKLASP